MYPDADDADAVCANDESQPSWQIGVFSDAMVACSLLCCSKA